MVVVCGRDAHRPSLFGILHANGEAIALLRIVDYAWWKLNSTCVISVWRDGHQNIVGRSFPSLAAAVQHCHEKIVGGTTDPLRAVKIPFVQKLPNIILEKNARRPVLWPRDDPWAIAHVDTHVEQPVDFAAAGSLVEIGLCQPFIPHTLSRTTALDRTHWSHYRPKRESHHHTAVSSTSKEPTAELRKSDLHHASASGRSGKDGDGHRKKRVKRSARKVPQQKGACVWVDPRGVPPVAAVIREVWEDKGDATREFEVNLFLESLAPSPGPPIWRKLREVSNFDAELPKIYEGERRAFLTECGVWDATVAVVKCALMHRLLMLPHKSAYEVWTNIMDMHDEPCPLTDEEAAKWRRTHAVESSVTEEGRAVQVEGGLRTGA